MGNARGLSGPASPRSGGPPGGRCAARRRRCRLAATPPGACGRQSVDPPAVRLPPDQRRLAVLAARQPPGSGGLGCRPPAGTGRSRPARAAAMPVLRLPGGAPVDAVRDAPRAGLAQHAAHDAAAQPRHQRHSVPGRRTAAAGDAAPCRPATLRGTGHPALVARPGSRRARWTGRRTVAWIAARAARRRAARARRRLAAGPPSGADGRRGPAQRLPVPPPAAPAADVRRFARRLAVDRRQLAEQTERPQPRARRARRPARRHRRVRRPRRRTVGDPAGAGNRRFRHLRSRRRIAAGRFRPALAAAARCRAVLAPDHHRDRPHRRHPGLGRPSRP